MTVKVLGRRHGSDASFYKWRSCSGGMDVADARRLRELAGEHVTRVLDRVGAFPGRRLG